MNIEKDLIIILLVALLIFGPSKLAGLGSALGKTIRDFRKAMEGMEPSAAKDDGLHGAGQREADTNRRGEP